MNPTTNVQKTRRAYRLTSGEIVITGMFAAVLAILSQISLPMPSGVPITVQVFGVALVGAVLGWRLGLLATVVYILLGAVGLPIFANFRGGIGVLTGMTGGYVWAWPLMAVLCGIRPRISNNRGYLTATLLLSLLGLAIDELAGGLQWAALAGDMSLWGVFAYSLTAFLPKDVILTILAVILSPQIRKLLRQAGYCQR